MAPPRAPTTSSHIFDEDEYDDVHFDDNVVVRAIAAIFDHVTSGKSGAPIHLGLLDPELEAAAEAAEESARWEEEEPHG